MMMSRITVSMLCWSLLLGLLASSANAAEPPKLPPLTAAPLGATSYQVRLQALDGRKLSLAEFKGKVLFLHYWATYCGACVEELPSIQRLWTRMRGRDDVAFLIVKKDNYEDSFEKVMKTGPYDFPIYTEKGKAKEFPNAETPVTYIVDRKGNIRFQGPEALSWDDPVVDAYLIGLARE